MSYTVCKECHYDKFKVETAPEYVALRCVRCGSTVYVSRETKEGAE